MAEATRAIEFIDAAVTEALDLGLVHLNAEDDRLDGRSIRIHERATLHFASCSYLGLELDPRVKRGAIDAVHRYGAQFSSSRSYVSAPLYQELEFLLDRIFDAHTLVTASTTLAHLSGLPVLIDDRDAVVVDHQVHQSVQMVIPQLRTQGCTVELVRHGRIDQLDARIRALTSSHRRVWYLADGVYSMFGDFAPVRALGWLLERHPSLHLYLDDAHGMSWLGRNGRGFAAEVFAGHPRVVVAVSLNKAFGAAGGALVFSDPELARKVRACGSPMLFTGPVQPPMLGAAVASAHIHLSPEIATLQAALRERILLARARARELELPLASEDEVPIGFLGLGLKKAAFDMATHLMERGIYVNPAAFPAVGAKHAGVRFTLTLHQSEADVERLLRRMAERLPVSLAAAETTRADVERAFARTRPPPRQPASRAGAALRCHHEQRIEALDAPEWDVLLGGRGCFDRHSLKLLEAAFGHEQALENRWRFHYWAVRDEGGRLLLATFFTEALWKDDLLATAHVSRLVEERRREDPHLLTSRVLAMGSLLTEGNHLYLDRGGDWRNALRCLFTGLDELRELREAPAVVLRDLPAEDPELAAFLEDAGFVCVKLPSALSLDLDWRSREEFLARRSKRERKFHREQVMPFEDAYEVERLHPQGRRPEPDEWRHLYQLYRNVQSRSFALNTFALPEDLLERMAATPGWEILLLRLRPSHGGSASGAAQGFMACHVGDRHLVPVLAGMDYALVESHGLYRQLLWQTILRAQAVGARHLHFGMGAELEKRRFGARAEERVMYVQSHDRYQRDVLALLAADAELQERD